MATVYINGKFVAQRMTGVQRTASQCVAALDRLLAKGSDPHQWVLLHPPGAPAPRLRRVQCRAVGTRGMPLHAWEQLVLPMAARRGRLVNLAGSSPVWPAGQVCVLHDAAVFDAPQGYTRRFAAWYAWQFRRQARQAAQILTVSEFSRRRLAERLNLPAHRIRVVPNGGNHLDDITADRTVLQRHALEGQRYLLAVGSRNPNKNIALLRLAFAELRAKPEGQGLRLVLVGETREQVFAAGNEVHAPEESVIELPHCNDRELKALYSHALALVFPSHYEGFGLPPLEAMSCGCPVVAARSASLPEICGDAALYFDPTSRKDLVRALLSLIEEDGLRQRLVRAGARHFPQWSWDRSAACLYQALDDVL